MKSNKKMFMFIFFSTGICLIFSKESKFYGSKNEMVVDKMKVEHKRIMIKLIGLKLIELIELKSKIYLMLSDDGEQSNTAKGVKILRLSLMNLETLYLIKKVLRHKIKRIQSEKHKLGTYEIKKISLSCFHAKRFVLNDGIHTLAYFHKDIDSHK